MIAESKYWSDAMRKHFNKKLVMTKEDDEGFENSTKWDLLNYVPHVLSCPTCLVLYVLLCFTCPVPYVILCPTWLVSYVLLCLMCPCASSASCHTWPCAWPASCLSCSGALHASCTKCSCHRVLCTLRTPVPIVH